MSRGPAIPTVDVFSPPSDAHALWVCKAGSGAETCRYLDETDAGWSCVRHTDDSRDIDDDVAAGLRLARAINCDGRGTR